MTEQTPEHEHRDLDALADVLAADSDGAAVPADVAGCPTCAAQLDALRSALPAVAQDLAALPAVPPVPAVFETGLPAAPDVAPDGAMAPPVTAAAATILPEKPVTSLDERRPRRWLLPAGGLAAAAVVVVGGGLLLTHNATDSTSSSRAAARAQTFPISDSGAHYSKTTLPGAVPRLLSAKRGTVSDLGEKAPAPSGVAGPKNGAPTHDPLAMLRTPAGLASCLAGLSGPDDSGLPLAIDYASWGQRPALVVVLPASRASKLDVFVVGANCTHQESDLIYYLRADRPTG